ncbi:fimbrial protein [Klebsiella aerogenes]|uniref:fimbrial protein n=1 Tax=Klebsiella aerogenes TaxID=548 RepID=UPI001CFB3813|nr:fimbrial protein [Klebsiella aerogenes]EKV3450937.1 fimbrial protein [Klebsiella aerogenes]ELW9553333.1 fimbrial protein [Klebsiella aerogenes]EMF0803274.1 fimbrial protein [Klebsiella aerogenes]MCB4376408.1 fimbrial protein [Klebsiella aerogenes]HBV9990757.1 fimbrial protein [Klebsiella aerogenes]
MKVIMVTALCLEAFFSLSNAFAATVKNDYVFVENTIDGEYFITPAKTDPRFSGANVFTKYSSENQDSLGYMGSSGALGLNQYADIWLENSPIDKPFIGQRCKRNASGCPTNGYLSGDYISHNGAYHININTHAGGAGIARGIFSNSAYEYFKNVAVGSTESYQYNYCSTKMNYNPASGQTCVSMGGKQGTHTFSVTKVGHLKLESTNALQEIFIDSSGSPSIGLGSQFCKVGYIGSINGAICKMVSYTLNGETLTPMRINMKVDAGLVGFTPSSKDIQISSDGASGWEYYDYKVKTSEYFKPGHGGIYVFLSQTFLKQLINNSLDLTNSQKFFTFQFTSTVAPQSGFYEFSPSNSIILHTRDYGISIISKDLDPKPHREGKVGRGEPALVFDYTVTTSGPRQANSIIAQVSGPMDKLNGQSYCIFSSEDGKTKVPFSAYLSWTKSDGKNQKIRSGCDNLPISLENAQWMETAWPLPYQNDGSFYRTDLKLTFPMDESTSLSSLDGRDWMGIVSAAGEIKVTAVWSGADIQ